MASHNKSPIIRLEDRLLLTAVPSVSVDVPTEVDLGSDFSASLTFDNTTLNNTTGYVPYVDLVLPTTGIDGAGSQSDDGITFNGATFLGTPLTTTEIVFDALGEATHPFAVDSLGAPIVVNGTPGDSLVVIELPFGSFTGGQTPAEIVVDLSLSEDADLNAPLTLAATGGFALGTDPLDNPTTDAPIRGATTAGQTEPIVADFVKTYLGPEDETATGPNYPRTYELRLDLADGAEFEDIILSDVLPDHIVPLSASVTTGPGGASISLPGGFNNGPLDGTDAVLTVDVGDLTGGPGVDVVVEIEFYVAEFDAAGDPVLTPGSGADRATVNDASFSGTFVPNDSRDTNEAVTIDDSETNHTLESSPLVIQKSATNLEGGDVAGLSPGDTIEYTLNIQVSDFFTFDNITLDDLLGDGQVFDASTTPTFVVTQDGTSTGGNFTVGTTSGGPDTFDYIFNAATGETAIEIDLSTAMGGSGILQGGLAAGAGNEGATTVSITYRSVVQDNYVTPGASGTGEAPIGQGDRIGNTADVTGRVLDNGTQNPTGDTSTDDSAAQLRIETGSITKETYAVNGAAPVPGQIIAAGDEITFRLTYELPQSAVEEFTISDFLPLPIFNAGEITTFDPTISSGVTDVPPAGTVMYGSQDTFNAIYTDARDGDTEPNLVVNTDDNAVSITYGTFSPDPRVATTVDLLLTVTVVDADFADGLLFTNQVTGVEANTELESTQSDAIVQVNYGQPELNISKGVIQTDSNLTTSFSPTTVAPSAVSAVGNAGFRFTSPISSDDLDTTPIDSNLSGIDAGDTVSFAIVVENTGSSPTGAFDVTISDSLPPGFSIPPTGLNLSVTDGNGNTIGFTGLDADADATDDIFGSGIRLNDPSATQGALSTYDGSSGTNLVVITYDLVADNTAVSDATITNTAEIDSFAAQEGGTSRTPDAADATDDADVITITPEIDKVIVSTSLDQSTQDAGGVEGVTIGETITYEITTTFAEGTTLNAVLGDIVSSADGAIDLVSAEITAIGGDLTLGNAAITVGSRIDLPGSADTTASFNLGNVVNDGDNDVDGGDRITMTVVARATNATEERFDAGGNSLGFFYVNDRGDELSNTGQLTYTDGDGVSQSVSDIETVDVLIPDLDIVKSVSPSTADAGDIVSYDIVVRHSALSDVATFDLQISDLLDSNIVLDAGTFSISTTEAATGPATSTMNIVVNEGNVVGDTSIDVEIDQFDLGDIVRISFDARIVDDVPAGLIIPNTASVTHDTLPGSSTESANFSENDSANVRIDAPGLTKTIVDTDNEDTSEDNSAAGDVSLHIGEQVTYELVITVPEGETPLVLTDQLPIGTETLEFVSAQVMSVGGNLTLGTDPATITPSNSNGDAFLDRVTFDFGTVTNIANNSTPSTDDQIIVRVTALVVDVAANQDGDTATNVGTLNYGNPNGSGDLTISASAAADIVEPVLTISKTTPSTGVDSGDTVPYTIVVTNDGTAPFNSA